MTMPGQGPCIRWLKEAIQQDTDECILWPCRRVSSWLRGTVCLLTSVGYG